jgi:hypothetical protein
LPQGFFITGGHTSSHKERVVIYSGRLDEKFIRLPVLVGKLARVIHIGCGIIEISLLPALSPVVN